MNSGEALTVTMTRDEALVLLEMFADLRDEASVPVRDKAERRALWNLVCNIEKCCRRFSSLITLSVLKSQNGIFLADRDFVGRRMAVYKPYSMGEDNKFALYIKDWFVN